MVFGKNTMIRKCIRNMCEDGEHPEWESIIGVMRGNLGFIFTNVDLDEILDIIKDFVKPAAAKAGVIAPCSCTIPKGPTGLDPAQTSFFQALNIATKINKGSIEIINDCTVIKEGVKVGSSEAALLTKLNIKPFTYGLAVKYIYEGGVFSPDVLKITDDILIGKMMMGIGQVQALSIGASFLTAASLAPTIANGFANVLAVALEADYLEFEQVQKVKEFLDNPDAFVCAAPVGGGGGGQGAGTGAGAGGGGRGDGLRSVRLIADRTSVLLLLGHGPKGHVLASLPYVSTVRKYLMNHYPPRLGANDQEIELC